MRLKEKPIITGGERARGGEGERGEKQRQRQRERDIQRNTQREIQ